MSAKNSFYKVLDKIRGVARRSSAVSDQATDHSAGLMVTTGASGSGGGQAEFLASMTRMSDSRIVENWLLSIEDDQLSEPPPLETLTLPESRTDQKTVSFNPRRLIGSSGVMRPFSAFSILISNGTCSHFQ